MVAKLLTTILQVSLPPKKWRRDLLVGFSCPSVIAHNRSRGWMGPENFPKRKSPSIRHWGFFLMDFSSWWFQPTHLKNMSQNGNLPQIGVKTKNVWNHHLVFFGSRAVARGFLERISLFSKRFFSQKLTFFRNSLKTSWKPTRVNEPLLSQGCFFGSSKWRHFWGVFGGQQLLLPSPKNPTMLVINKNLLRCPRKTGMVSKWVITYNPNIPPLQVGTSKYRDVLLVLRNYRS